MGQHARQSLAFAAIARLVQIGEAKAAGIFALRLGFEI